MYNRHYYERNKEMICELSRLWYSNNKEHVAERMKEYYKNNKSVIRKVYKLWYMQHCEELKSKRELKQKENYKGGLTVQANPVLYFD